MKIATVAIVLAIALLCSSQAIDSQELFADSNGTESYFFSPTGLGRTPEVNAALDKIRGEIRVKHTTCNVSSITYIIDNVTMGLVYNPSKQNVTIPKNDLVNISGGRFEFTYQFNYTKIENRNNITGYAYGSVLSDGLTYFKEFSFCAGFLCFRLPPTNGSQPVTITNRMTIKRMDPYNETDLANLQKMLDETTQNIEPANLKQQILPNFNQVFPLALNDSLNHEIFGENISYTYHSNTHGDMKINITHELHGFGISPETGYRIIFLSKIDNFNENTCDLTVPLKPASFQIYGGSQAYHLNCFYQNVILYLQSNGWLDINLNSDWQVDAFQFYAGDLFDLINNLYSDFSPRAILDGKCVAQKQNIRFISSREFDANTYALQINYKCSLKGTNNAGSTAEVLRFTAFTRIYIVAEATRTTLTFKIVNAIFDELSFDVVGKYAVNNVNLAKYRASKVLSRVQNTFTFGTGYPTVARQLPKTRVDHDWVFYYDSSHIDMSEVVDLKDI